MYEMHMHDNACSTTLYTIICCCTSKHINVKYKILKHYTFFPLLLLCIDHVCFFETFVMDPNPVLRMKMPHITSTVFKLYSDGAKDMEDWCTVEAFRPHTQTSCGFNSSHPLIIITHGWSVRPVLSTPPGSTSDDTYTTWPLAPMKKHHKWTVDDIQWRARYNLVAVLLILLSCCSALQMQAGKCDGNCSKLGGMKLYRFAMVPYNNT